MSRAEMGPEELLEDDKITRLETIAFAVFVIAIIMFIASGYFLVHYMKDWFEIMFFGSGIVMVLDGIYWGTYVSYKCRKFLEKYAKSYYGYKGLDGKTKVIIIDDEPQKIPQKRNSNNVGSIVGVWIFVMALLVFAFPSDASILTIIVFGIAALFITMLAVVRIING